MGQQEFADDAEIIEEVTDRQWFLLLSMTKSFAEGSGLPGQAWQSSRSVGIAGRKNLANYSCERARQAQIYGLRTLVFISEIGVIELGFTALNFQRMDLVYKTEQLLNVIYSLKMFQPGDESVSSNSIGNCVIVTSKTDLSEEEEEFSLGLHLGFKGWPAKPKNEAKSSSSYACG